MIFERRNSFSTLKKLHQFESKAKVNHIIDTFQGCFAVYSWKRQLRHFSNKRRQLDYVTFCERETENDKNTLKTLTVLCTLGVGISARKRVSKQRVTDLRLQNSRIELKEVNLETKIQWQRLNLVSAPVTQGICIPAQVHLSGSALKSRFTVQRVRWFRDETLNRLRVTIFSSVQGFWPWKRWSVSLIIRGRSKWGY